MNIFLDFIIKVGIVWVIFFVIMKILEKRFRSSLLKFLETHSISIQLFHIGWSTTRMNQSIMRLALKFEKFWIPWFKVGSWVTLALLPLSIGLLVYNLVLIYFQPHEEPIISPIVPGVNVKSKDTLYLYLSIMISMVFHELGHALASYVCRCKINSIGFFFIYILPGASVNMDYEELHKSGLWDRLKIYTAGVWHNTVLCIIGYLLLCTTPILLSPLYYFSNNQLYVTFVPEHSPLVNSLSIGDEILSINECNVFNRTSLIDCIYKELDQPKAYCINQETMNCINNLIKSNHTEMLGGCFDYSQVSTMMKCDPTSVVDKCQKYTKSCVNFDAFQYHVFNLRVKGQDFDSIESLSFLGTAQQLWDSFEANNYRLRFNTYKSRLARLSYLDLPYHLYQFFGYLIPVSAGLGVFNVISIYGLDGEYILDTLISLILVGFSRTPRESKEKFKAIFLKYFIISCTTLFSFTILYSYYNILI
ncbi:hypothetical protein CYY_005562 [Polysphondylium violaceum]|uniref:Endopeptidase S2P n=1 Tax=Polysphondylium violaceum TaxID=133409 RepID=A0A8J4Q2U4_9MYCE|nr:hypothetical protein CYY_005562 [Polysphondylium violaceum]